MAQEENMSEQQIGPAWALQMRTALEKLERGDCWGREQMKEIARKALQPTPEVASTHEPPAETPPCIWRLGCQRPALCKDRGHCMGNEGTAQPPDSALALLREIVHEYDQTHDGEVDEAGRARDWSAIPSELIERARRLLP